MASRFDSHRADVIFFTIDMKKFSSQISLALITLLLIGFLLLLIIVDNLLKSNLQSQLIENMKIECVMIDQLLPSSPDSIRQRIPQIAKTTQGRLTVIDLEGNVIGDSEEGHLARPLDNHLHREEVQIARMAFDGFGSSIRHSDSVNDELIYTAYQSPKDRFIRLAKKQAFINEIIFKLRVILIISALGAIGVVLLLIPNISKRITKPLSDIVFAAEEIKKGNYDKEIVVKEDNEIGELSKILNAMSSKLKGDILQLNQLQEIRKDFVANASHELRTPVSSIRGYIETLLDGALHDEEVAKKFLERTMSNIVRLEQIVNDMLDLSKLESRDRGLSLRYIDPVGIVENLAADFREMAAKKGLMIHVESTLDPEFKLFADAYQFEKAVLNLLENAIKYTEQGYVRLSLSSDENSFQFVVEDSGSGIKPEELPRIFERFYRVDKGRSREEGGSGLGLSIVKHVMEIHKGSVKVDSIPGKGSRFILTFPFLTPAAFTESIRNSS